MKKAKCYNCKYSSHQFKVGKLTHIHCEKPEYDKWEQPVNPWETLRVFSDTCEDHEFKNYEKARI